MIRVVGHWSLSAATGAIRILTYAMRETESPETRAVFESRLLDFLPYGKQTAIIVSLAFEGRQRKDSRQRSSTKIVKAKIIPAKIKDFLADSMTSRVSFTLDSTLDSVNKVELTAEELAAKAGFDEDTVPHIAMAVREAAVNAVLHGNAYDTGKHITASFETTVESLIIRIADQGPGLNPDTIPDPLAPENILRGSGRGIFLIRAFMDEVNFRQLHPGTELTLIKHRTPAQPGT